MDETEKTQQDTSLEKETSPGGSEGTTPTETKTFTEEDVLKRIQGDRVARGRDAKSLETREATVKAQEEANKAAGFDLERQRLEAQKREIEALSDDPEAKKALLRSYDLDKKERELNEREKANREAMQRMFDEAEALAAEHSLKPSDLLSAGTPEAMKLLAKNLALQRELDSRQTKETPKEKEGFPAPDSGTSDAGTDDDASFQKRWNAGDIKATKENIARIQKILNK